MKLIRFASRPIGSRKHVYGGLGGLLVSSVLLGIGYLRYHSYDVHMFRGNYVEALKSATVQEPPEDMEQAVPPGFKGPKADMPWALRAYWQTTDAVVGERTNPAFNHAKRLYDSAYFSDTRTATKEQMWLHRSENPASWESAWKALNLAYSACCNEQGKVKPEYKKLASKILTMMGNTAYLSHPDPDQKKQEKKLAEALANYEDAIRLDPSNAQARINTELRKNSAAGGGKGQKDKDKKEPSGSPSTRKKI